MKSLELNAWDLEEVSVSESIAVNGGQACIPWGIVLEYLARIFAGGVVGWSIYEMFSEEEVIEIYGGELDPFSFSERPAEPLLPRSLPKNHSR